MNVNGPAVLPTPGTRPTATKEVTVDDVRIPPAGDGFYAAAQKQAHEHLARLEEKYRHELLDDEKRMELRDLIIRMRRRCEREDGLAMNYARVKALAKELGCRVPDLLVLARGNDPFYVGTPAQVAQAEWFAELWERFGSPSGVHLRRLHYRIVGLREPLSMHDGRPYLNTEGCWEYLNYASKYARILELVDPKVLVDHRNPAARIYMERNPLRDSEVGWEHVWDGEEEYLWQLPEIRTDLS